MTPNLLFIWTDEQRPDTCAAYGNNFVETPALNRLASQSAVFENAYCCQPVCTPSRGCILSGLWPHQHGARSNNIPIHTQTKTIAELVSPDYRRAYYGKWHLGDEIIAQHGFTEWLSIEDAMYRPYFSNPQYLEGRSSYHDFLDDHGFFPDMNAQDGAACFSRNLSAAMPYRFTKAGFLADRAAWFLREHDPAQPFLLSVNFLEPHMPFFSPLNDRYNPDDIPVGPAFNRRPDPAASIRNQALAAHYARGFGRRPLKTEYDWRRVRANYLGLVTMVDQAVGHILESLELAGLADNTIVVFTSDHGEMMGDHALLAKGVMYEEATRIPLMIRAPWITRQPRRIAGNVSQIDLVPTLLDLMNQPVPDYLQGTSRAPVLEGRETLRDNDVFFLWSGDEYEIPADLDVPGISRDQLDNVARQEWRCMVTPDRWKLNLCAQDAHCELYDLNTDPHELTNRYTDPAQQPRIRDMTARITAWQKSVGDPTPLPVG